MTNSAPDGGVSNSVARHWPLAAGLALIALLWGGPLPERAIGSFAAHMTMHMGVVAVASPLLAIGILRSLPFRLAGVAPRLVLLAALVEFVVVWGWHAPALHDAARREIAMLVLEQASFLGAGLFVWLTVFGATSQDEAPARAAGVAGLLVTSMHMTLLGALLTLSPRPLYACADLCSSLAARTPLADQQLGGLIMLAVGGIVYMTGGLYLLASLLRQRGNAGGATRGPA